MNYTTNFNFRKPENTDLVRISDLNSNMDIIDTELAKKIELGDLPTSYPYSMITGTPTSLPANGGNADTVDSFHLSNRSGWSGLTDHVTVGMLAWRNYGNGHAIFDASKSLSPDGGVVSNTNPQNKWVASYPTLMGWNGAGTYGVRVDSARNADTVGGRTIHTSTANPSGGVNGDLWIKYTP